MRQHKFRQGRYVRTFADAADLIDRGEWIYWWHKPQHPQVLLHMMANNLKAAAERGALRLAVLNKDENKNV